MSLLWIDEARDKDKTYIWLSVWWRLKTKGEEYTCLVYTGLIEELEHLKIKTRLIDEMFPSVKGDFSIRSAERNSKVRMSHEAKNVCIMNLNEAKAKDN